MIMAYLINAVIVAFVCTIIWLVAGGSLVMGFAVYAMSGLLAIVAMASASFIKTYNAPD